MTRDEILNMPAGREMDAMIADKVMGGLIAHSPDDRSEVSQTWFWISDQGTGVLIGKPYDAHEGLRGVGGEEYDKPSYSHSWRSFKPSTDIADAWTVVEKVKLHVGPTNEGHWYASNVHDLNQNNVILVIADTAPLAICRAARLVAEAL